MVDLRNLETFVWVAHLGGFRTAAEKLNTTQPAVSQRIAQLEDELAVKLFQREARGAKLTVKGFELLGYAERMLALRADMLQALREKKAMRGVVRLGVAETIVHTWLSRLIERMHAVYPAITLEIEVDTTPILRQSLLSHQLDIAFVLGPMSEPRMKNVNLGSYPMAWVASPSLDIGPEPVRVTTLGRWPIITYPRNTRPYIAVNEMLIRADVPNRRIYGNASLSTIVRMTLDNIGISAIPPVVIQRELAEGRLRMLRAEAVLPDLTFTATYPVKPDSYMAEAVAELAREVAASEPGRLPGNAAGRKQKR
ncbi:LysR family transcriptional regulator [Ferrovibrio sp. MS7]|jgi:DNA-binding transcriptional LysR family regulator|uniref:LysR family transcriptional regulator n=1 Tax=Ferrovibrio TaxID=1231242 RepID=UPI001B5B8706|nr:LysR family transcriptional regulator [Ferrovibrio sp.]